VRTGGRRACGTQLGSIHRVSIDPASVPAIDMRAISQLAESDDTGDQFIAEIIEVYVADLSERVRKISLQMNEGDSSAVAATAHAIKGSSGHFGAAHLIELSREIEDRARRKQTDGLQTNIDSLIEEAERVRAALEAFRSNHGQR
jgi:HPt (histidine-containing phosphotransfer) domain-containing protein